MKVKSEFIQFNSEDFQKITALRREVFCGEGFSCIKRASDENAKHIIFHIDGFPIACGSLIKIGEDYEIYGLAVNERYRRFGMGSRALKSLISLAKEHGAEAVEATCPLSALGFLEKNGMAKTGVPVSIDGEKFIKCRKDFVFDEAKWVAFAEETEAVIVQGEFNVNETENAILFASGLGFCEIYINGKIISDRKLAPAWTNYCKKNTVDMEYPIFDTFTYRILYEKLDVTKFIKKGKNTISFHIGGGWFCQHESLNEGVKPYGKLMLCFKLLQGENVVAVSDSNLKWRKSFVKRANIYMGEEQDGRLGGFGFNESPEDTAKWKNAEETEAPLALLEEQNCPSDRVIREIAPKCIFKKGSYAIYDLGENVAGYPIVSFPEKSYIGEECIIRYAEELNEDGSLNFASTGGYFRVQTDIFIHHLDCREYYPRFTWHGCRYFEVSGNVEIVAFKVLHTDIEKIVDFKSSDETIQWIFDAYVRTQLNNIHCCVPSDCPHRERLGYTGDGQLTVGAVMTCFDAEALYRKWMQDIADSQDIYSGHVSHTAPFYGGGGGPGGWGGAMVIVPYKFYKKYGDKSVLKKYYPNMLLYLDYMRAHSENGIITREEQGGWCLGDWCSPGNKNLIPEPFVNTYFYLKTLELAIEIAEFLGESSDELKARYETAKASFLKEFYDEKTATFCGSLEAADAYGFDLGFGDEKTLAAIVEKYEALGEFDTGIFGTDILIRTLCENGYKALAFKLLASKKENSFFNMKKQGATTLWENWDGADSHSHPMFGAVVEHIVNYFNEK